MPAEMQSYKAIRAVNVIINLNQRDRYVSQLKNFATTHKFTAYFSQTSPDPNDIAVHMVRSDVELSCLYGEPFSSGPNLRYEIFFSGYLGRPTSAATLDPLVDALKKLMNQIDGAVVTERPLGR